jgi:hypothetical protein
MSGKNSSYFIELKPILIRAANGPAFPLALLVNGSFFYFAAMFLLNIAPNSIITGCYYLGLIGIALFLSIRGGKFPQLSLQAADIFFLIWIALITVSLFYYGISGREKLLIYLGLLVVFPYFCGRLIRLEDISSFLIAIILISCCGFLLAILDGFFRSDIVLSWVKPVFFNFNHTNLLLGFIIGGLLVVMFQVFLTPVARLQQWGKKFLLVSPLFILGLVFLVSRGVLLAMLVVMTFSCLSAVWVPWSRRIGLFMFVMLMVAVSFQITPESRVAAAQLVLDSFEQQIFKDTAKDTAKDRVKDRVESDLECGPVLRNNNSVDIRIMFWKEAWRMFVENPLFGVGAGQFGKYSCAPGGFPHSPIVQAFSELGLFGGGLYVLFIASSVSCFWLVIRRSSNFKLRILAWLIFPLWLFYLLIDQMYGNYFMNTAFVLLCGIAVAMAGHSTEEVCSQ